MFLSGWVRNNSITTIFYQAGRTDIQNDINRALWDRSFSEAAWREEMGTGVFVNRMCGISSSR